MPDNAPVEVLLQMPPDLKYLHKIRDAIRDAGERQDVPKTKLYPVLLAVDEAASNVIRHAYADGREGLVKVNIRLLPHEIRVEICDHGKPFDMTERAAVDIKARAAGGARGGYGIEIIKRLMDEWSYEREGDENRLTLVKRFVDATVVNAQLSKHHVLMELHAQLKNLAIIRDTLFQQARQLDIERAAVYPAILAVDEACTNVIRKAYRGDENNFLKIIVETTPAETRILICDAGEGFDFDSVPPLDVKRAAAERRRDGYGVHLIRALMDECEYTRQDNENRLRLVKRFNGVGK